MYTNEQLLEIRRVSAELGNANNALALAQTDVDTAQADVNRLTDELNALYQGPTTARR